MRHVLLSLGILFACSCAQALDKNDLCALAKAGVSDEIVIKLVETSDPKIALTPDDVLELRKARVSEKVILAALSVAAPAGQEKAVAEGPQAPQPASAPAPAPQPAEAGSPAEAKPQPAPLAVPTKGQGTLTIQNLLDDELTMGVDEKERVLYFSLKDDNALPVEVEDKGSSSVFLKKGTYKVRWVGQTEAYEAKIKEGKVTTVAFSGDKDVSVVVTDYEGKTRDSGIIKEDKDLALKRAEVRQLEEENKRLREQAAQPTVIVQEDPVVVRRPVVVYQHRHYIEPYPGYRPVIVGPPCVVVRHHPSHHH